VQSRIRHPAIMPHASEQLWDATYYLGAENLIASKIPG
jgi:hypothetical protein